MCDKQILSWNISNSVFQMERIFRMHWGELLYVHLCNSYCTVYSVHLLIRKCSMFSDQKCIIHDTTGYNAKWALLPTLPPNSTLGIQYSRKNCFSQNICIDQSKTHDRDEFRFFISIIISFSTSKIFIMKNKYPLNCVYHSTDEMASKQILNFVFRWIFF